MHSEEEMPSTPLPPSPAISEDSDLLTVRFGPMKRSSYRSPVMQELSRRRNLLGLPTESTPPSSEADTTS